jgi:alpha-mannosidase
MTGVKIALLAGLGLLLLFEIKAAPQEIEYWPRGTTRWLQGYARSVSGETIAYHSAQPDVNSALLVRAMDKKSQIEWQTEVVPTDWGDSYVTFIWLAGMATQKGGHKFNLYADSTSLLTFTTAEDASPKLRIFSGQAGAELMFKATKVDQFDELFGYMFLKLPLSLCRKGQALRLKVIGEPAGSPDWYMTFESGLSLKVEACGEQVLVQEGGKLYQLARVDITHIGPPQRVTILAPGAAKTEKALKLGYQSIDLLCEPVQTQTTIPVEVRVEEKTIATPEVNLNRVRNWKIYLLPHSHNDIGYSDLQRVVEKNQWKYYEQAIDLAKKTADYPPEARFKWNVEILWAVESYLAQATEEKREKFIQAVRQGSIGLQAFFCNPLTGLFNPEEFFHLTEYARSLSSRYGFVINSAMITDIPGSLWSVVPALAQSGVKYYSSGPNFMPFLPDLGDRIGSSLRAWGDRPFYWVSPSGQEKILFWMTGKGYSWFHGLNQGQISRAGEQPIFDYVRDLQEKNYPYDMVQVRYTIGGDNGPPDPELPDFVRRWNERYASPQLIIATSGQMFGEFESRYRERLPSVRGDFTPYWEDGALSTVRETALNRNSANALLQAEALWAMLAPDEFPAEEFYRAWRQVVLFDEHTWGAHNSVSQPDDPAVAEQWEYKKALAEEGEEMSQTLLRAALAMPESSGLIQAVDVYNSNSWTRTDLVVLPTEWDLPGIRVEDARGNPTPSQRLSTGELAFLARAVPPLGAERFFLRPGNPKVEEGPAAATSTRLTNGLITVGVDQTTGAISILRSERQGVDFVDKNTGAGLNEYLYVLGRDPEKAQPAGQTKVSVLENGPVVASLLVESEAAGCNRLIREIRLVQGLDDVEISDNYDKKKIREKESIHFGFPFHVPGGILRADVGWGVIEPETDQIAGACKDFLCVHNWVDMSNSEYGLTMTTRDSALVEPGSMTDESLSGRGTRTWKERMTPGQVIYSYAANNYWHTNYKADQEGWVTLRYSIRPHQQFEPARAKRFGLERSQPLIVAPADLSWPPTKSLFEVNPAEVLVTSIRPSADKQALMIRIYNASGLPQKADILWKSFKPVFVFSSSPFEEKKEEMPGSFDLSAFGIFTLRAERPR